MGWPPSFEGQLLQQKINDQLLRPGKQGSSCERLYKMILSVHKARIVEEHAPDLKTPTSNAPQVLLEYVLRDSPKLRSLFVNLADQVTRNRSKALVWVMYPGSQLFLLLLLKTFGYNAQGLVSGMTLK